MSDPDSSTEPLQREDWDFSQVPDKELEACFSWECAREWEPFAREFREFFHGEKTDEEKMLRLENRRDRLAELTNVRDPWTLVDVALDGVDDPWQLLPYDARAMAVFLKNPGLTAVRDEQIADVIRDQRSDSNDIAVFRVNWHETDNRLINDFSEWLKKNRDAPSRENRGSTPRDRLKMLGAMRLLHHYTHEEAFAFTHETLGAPLYGPQPSWIRARKGALEAFREFFFVDWKTFSQAPFPKSYPRHRRR